MYRIQAGLFSAVVTTFVAQSSQKLDPDYAKIAASLLNELVLLQRATRAGVTSEIPISQLSFDSETYRSTDLWVNGLWLTSLTLSLLTALLSVLAKQWIEVSSHLLPHCTSAHSLRRASATPSLPIRGIVRSFDSTASKASSAGEYPSSSDFSPCCSAWRSYSSWPVSPSTSCP